MAGKHAQDLRRRMDAAFENLSRQLHGMEPHMERADAPGEWTTREVLSHLLFEQGFEPAAALASFSERDYPMLEIDPGATFLDDQRRRMTLPQFRDALDTQRRRVLEYIDGLEQRDFDQRKARIPLFKQFMGTDEITLDMYLGAMFDYHWNDHAGQIEKIRLAVGLGSVAGAAHT
jgi:DinB family protein